MENLIENQGASDELKRIYEADQEERAVGFENIDWGELKKNDQARLKRVDELYERGLIVSAEDMFYAGMIYQHGGPDYFKKAVELSKKSWDLGNDEGKWLFPRAEDRYLLSTGRAQIWGTQFIQNDKKIWHLQEPFDETAKTEEERREMGINIKEKLQKLNSDVKKE